MTIGRDDVLRVAELAELDVPARDVDGLVAQIGRIVDYVAQLNDVPASETAEPFQAGPDEVRLREDTPGSVPLAHGIERFAPEFRDGLFLVPRLGAMEGE
ncbi:MAG TPA: Asp-tRNA(Asn)/Glu-tRNA(Gln) amidotransferase subunit GatC [Gemmatimonadales bacterium]|nr:Asp-tRNA(Asn)/Glu-tRNA(Gln) amidotransferase subunit GatC [Gemmatimonadales bacterium]